ncbi:hypothetical protein [Paraburkholderia ferrariae]|uniref:hypothetical protein n=1 Tax=Paraburkholderia ferrariae TaxID=386056 RepID=UPI001470617C|nr:hypothetical protein [Paraburkholderia ferrariae]
MDGKEQRDDDVKADSENGHVQIPVGCVAEVGSAKALTPIVTEVHESARMRVGSISRALSGSELAIRLLSRTSLVFPKGKDASPPVPAFQSPL